MDFVLKIQEIKAEEGDDALFGCVLTYPLPKITWMKKGVALEDGEKYRITVSEDKLIHKLLIKDCRKSDKGIYSAIAGMTSCSAWLVVKGNIPMIYNSVLLACTSGVMVFINLYHHVCWIYVSSPEESWLW